MATALMTARSWTPAINTWQPPNLDLAKAGRSSSRAARLMTKHAKPCVHARVCHDLMRLWAKLLSLWQQNESKRIVQ